MNKHFFPPPPPPPPTHTHTQRELFAGKLLFVRGYQLTVICKKLSKGNNLVNHDQNIIHTSLLSVEYISYQTDNKCTLEFYHT